MIDYDFIKKHEAYREFAYPDPASPLARETRKRGIKVRWGFMPAAEIIASLPDDLKHLHGNPWTCGWGETEGVTYETRWSRAQADAKFVQRVQELIDGVLKLCAIPPNQNQLTAMCSLVYNVGLGNFRKSSVLKAHNRGDTQAAARAFNLWNKAGGRVMKGLTRRRAEEAALYLKPTESLLPAGLDEPEDLVSQAVEPERPMTQSSIVQASTLAGGTATLAAVSETVNAVSSIKYGLSSLGTWLVPILLVVTVAAVGWAIYERLKQRRDGIA